MIYQNISNKIAARFIQVIMISAIVFMLLFSGILESQGSAGNWSSAGEAKNNKVWTVNFSGNVDSATVDNTKIYVTDSEGNKIKNISLMVKDKSIFVSPDENFRYQQGDYNLHIASGIKSSEGEALAQEVNMPFTILGGNFFTFEDEALPAAVVGIDYATHLGGSSSNNSADWAISSGTLPPGLVLNSRTGEIKGVPGKKGRYDFTVKKGNSESKNTHIVVLANGFAEPSLAQIDVDAAGQPQLPTTVEISYPDSSSAEIEVFWNAVDTSNTGEQTVTGKLGGTDYTVNGTVKVSYIEDINIEHFTYLNTCVHTVVLTIQSDVYSADLNDKKMHYEGDNTFSMATTTLKSEDIAIISLFDRYGQHLENRTIEVE